MKYEFYIMKSLFKQLWLQSNNCELLIESMGYNLMEIAKCTGQTRNIIKIYFDYLIDQGYIENISITPLIYKFTDKGKQIKSLNDIEKIVINVA